MVPNGIEPRTLPLLAVRSNQMSYDTRAESQTRVDLTQAGNMRGPPHDGEADAAFSTKFHSGLLHDGLGGGGIFFCATLLLFVGPMVYLVLNWH